MFENGEGVEVDHEAGVAWYQKAADQDYNHAKYHLADLYEFGKGVAKDKTVAIDLYRTSAEEGYSYSQYYLG